jgi:hypothetical protein
MGCACNPFHEVIMTHTELINLLGAVLAEVIVIGFVIYLGTTGKKHQ